MISLLSSLGRKSLALPAVLIVWLLPTAVWAETITIKNMTPGIVKVLPACQVRGQVMPARPFFLKPGDTSPGIVFPATSYIEIRDATIPDASARSDSPFPPEQRIWNGPGAGTQRQADVVDQQSDAADEGAVTPHWFLRGECVQRRSPLVTTCGLLRVLRLPSVANRPLP